MPENRWDALTLGRWRRKRSMVKRLQVLEREYGEWAPPARSRKRPMSERRRTVIVVSAVSVIVAAVFGSGFIGVWAKSPQGNILAHAGKPGGKLSAGDHVFSSTQSDGKTPIAYDPCKTIHLVVNDRAEVKGGAALVDEAIAQVKKATGLSIVIDGPTDEKPSAKRPLHVDRYSADYAPVLLAWSDPKESPKLSGNVAGFAGSGAASNGSNWYYVSGTVTLDGPQLRRILTERDGRAMARAVIMHELGHLVGLGHVKAQGELMQPKGQPGLVTWGPGDLAGLSVLGSGQCA